jgi:hypothetical protein
MMPRPQKSLIDDGIAGLPATTRICVTVDALARTEVSHMPVEHTRTRLTPKPCNGIGFFNCRQLGKCVPNLSSRTILKQSSEPPDNRTKKRYTSIVKCRKQKGFDFLCRAYAVHKRKSHRFGTS